jgi:hypothetical protein
MKKTTHRLAWTCATAVLALALAACGGSTTPTGSAPAAAPTGSAPAAAPAGGTGSSGSSATKVSANTASEEEVTAALESAGVSNPQKWAHEVVEYRPYPADDPNLTALREKLAKYNPGQETTDKIVSALTP